MNESRKIVGVIQKSHIVLPFVNGNIDLSTGHKFSVYAQVCVIIINVFFRRLGCFLRSSPQFIILYIVHVTWYMLSMKCASKIILLTTNLDPDMQCWRVFERNVTKFNGPKNRA